MKQFKLILSSIAIATAAILSSCGGSNKETAVAKADGSENTEKSEFVRSGVYDLAADEILDFSTPVGHPVVVDFNATWCGPCQKFAPIFKSMAEKYDGQIEFISVDVDRCPEVAKAFEVQGIPHILFVSNDGKISSHVGLMTDVEFESMLQGLLK